MLALNNQSINLYLCKPIQHGYVPLGDGPNRMFLIFLVPAYSIPLLSALSNIYPLCWWSSYNSMSTIPLNSVPIFTTSLAFIFNYFQIILSTKLHSFNCTPLSTLFTVTPKTKVKNILFNFYIPILKCSFPLDLFRIADLLHVHITDKWLN